MKIGILEEGVDILCVQRRIGSEGHELHVCLEAEGMTEPAPNNFLNLIPYPATVYPHDVSYLEDCDLVIAAVSQCATLVQHLKDKGVPVIGALQKVDDLENDRIAAKKLAEETGLHLPNYFKFDTNQQALSHVLDNPSQNYVIKSADDVKLETWSIKNEYETQRTVLPPTRNDCIDILKNEDSYHYWQEAGGLVLEEIVVGVELAFSRMFNGKNFVGPVCINFEHKHSCEGDKGVLTGEMGTLLFYEDYVNDYIDSVFKKTESALEDAYWGMFDMNCILSEDGKLYFLEYTPRWGRPTMEIMINCWESDFTADMLALAQGKDPKYKVNKGFAVGTCVATYGYPVAVEELDHQVEVRGVEEAEAVENAFVQYLSVVEDTSGKIRACWNERPVVVTGLAHTWEDATNASLEACNLIDFWGAYYRKDIGAKWEEQRNILFNHGYISERRYGNTYGKLK